MIAINIKQKLKCVLPVVVKVLLQFPPILLFP